MTVQNGERAKGEAIEDVLVSMRQLYREAEDLAFRLIHGFDPNPFPRISLFRTHNGGIAQ